MFFEMRIVNGIVLRTLKWQPKKILCNFISKISFVSKACTVSFTTARNINFTMAENADSIKYINEITKSSEDKRTYRGLELTNKLKVLLISDPDSESSAAALNVGVGYLNDPEDIPGLAHFCEHMLFLGTEKYPDENDYAKFVLQSGGSNNATTGPDYTDFYFHVLPNHLKETLDRFAQFFLAPLFTESATEREINAVNSEFEKNVPIDEWRINQVNKLISKKHHPFRKFGIGNIKTLSVTPKEKGIDIRKELLNFHKTWYSANLMTLVVLGTETLDELEEMVVPLFSTVPNKNLEEPEWKEHPYGQEHLQIKNYVVPIKDVRNVTIEFPIPDFREHYKSCPFQYIASLIGHEGPGSLLSALKEKGWCNSLVSGYKSEANGFAFYFVKANLTEDGFDKIDDIVTLTFQYINMLKKVGPQKWFFEELEILSKTAFQFKEKESPMSYVRALAHSMHDYPLPEVLCGPYFYDEWKPDLLDLALTYLEPQYVRVSVVGQKLGKVADETEPWFGTKFKVEKIPETTIKKWESSGLCDDLKFPTPNAFITSNFKILPLDEKTPSPHPQIIYTSATSRVWFKQDDQFLLPKAHLKFSFESPLANLDPVNNGLTYLFVELLKDSLNEYDYYAKLAGLSWNVWKNDYGMMISIDGYNDKQGVLLDKVLERMTNFKVDPKRFEFLKEIYVRGLRNFEAAQPYAQSGYYLSLLMAEHVWTKNELLKATEHLTVKRLEEFIPHLLSKLHVECLIHGNINKEGALKVIDIFEGRLNAKAPLLPVLPSQLLRKRDIQLVDGTHFLYEEPNHFFSSSCTETYYQCDVLSTKNDLLMELLVQILQNPCFDFLRTKEQLGYIVLSGIRRSNCVQGLRIVVQSDRHPLYVEQRIEAFLMQFRQNLESMSQEEFEQYRESLATIKSKKPKRLSTLSSIFWYEISSQQYHFDRADVEVAFLRTITKEQLIEFFDKYIQYKAPHRRKLSVYVMAKGEGGAGNQEPPDEGSLSESADGLPPPPPYAPASKIEDIVKFKSSHGLYPLAQPYMNINATKSKL